MRVLILASAFALAACGAAAPTSRSVVSIAVAPPSAGAAPRVALAAPPQRPPPTRAEACARARENFAAFVARAGDDPRFASRVARLRTEQPCDVTLAAQ